MSGYTNKTEDGGFKDLQSPIPKNYMMVPVDYWAGVHFSCVQVTNLKQQAQVDPNFALQPGNSRILTFMSKLMPIVSSSFL